MSTDLKWEGGGGAGVEAEESPMLMFLGCVSVILCVF